MKKFFATAGLIIILCISVLGFSPSLYALEKSPSQNTNVQSGKDVSSIFLEKTQIQEKIIDTIGVMLIAYVLLFALIGIINRRIRNIKIRHTVRKNTVYLVNILLIGGIFIIWLQNINSVTLLLGFASAGLALALQEAILCVAGWSIIITRRPFEAGDRIEVNGIKGDVIDVQLFYTSLLEIGNWVDADQSTGRIVNVPNSHMFKSAHYNYSRGFEFIWNEIPILITFESDWKKAHELITRRVEKYAEGLAGDVQKKLEIMKNRYMIYYGKLTPIVYVNIKDSGVELTLRYLTEAKQRRPSRDYLCRVILEDFAKEPNVNLAYPTYRIVKE